MELHHDQGGRNHVDVSRRVRRRRERRGRRSLRLVLLGRRRDPHTEQDVGHDVPRLGAERRPPEGLDGRGRRHAHRSAYVRGADGWGGQHPWDIPAFVVTHQVPDGWPRPGSTVQFVTDGIESAVARAKSAAGPKSVGVHGAQTIQQCLDAGLLDEIHIDLAAVLLGAGVRLFDHLANTPAVLGNPTVVTGVGVTHLRYPVHTS